jgi:hypothetical protein
MSAEQNKQVDVVGIWNQSYEQFVPNARVMKCSINEPTKNMEHPVETGSVITDHRVVLPIEISLTIIMDPEFYVDQYRRIKHALKTAEIFYLHTRVGIFKNQMIVGIPHEEDPSMYDTISMNLTMKEVQLVEATFQPLPARKVEQKTNASTVNKGQINTKAPTVPQQRSFLKSIAAPPGF